MKPSLFMPLLLVAVLAAPLAMADTPRPVGPNAGYAETSLADLRNLRDDALVTLRGRITERLGEDEYRLVDAANNTVVVEIDEDLWLGLQVTDQDQVIIRGELDKDWNELEVEAHSLQLAN